MRKQVIIGMLLAALTVQAQGFGVQAGFKQSITRENSLLKPKELTIQSQLNGVGVGIFYEQAFWKGLGMMIGVNYAYGTQNTKWSKKDGYGWQTRTSSVAHTLEVPISLQYKIMIAKETFVVVYTGPILNYGISKKVNDYRRNSVNMNVELTNPNNNDWYKKDEDIDGLADYAKFNANWGVGLGLQFQNYTLRGGYSWGLNNHKADSYYNSLNYYTKARADEWSICVGYFFNATKR